MTEEVEENLGDGRGYENGTRPLATSSATSNGPVGRFRNFRSRLNTLTNSVTIEPVMFLHMLGISLTGVIVQDLYIERICRVKLGYPADTCADLVVNAGKLESFVCEVVVLFCLYIFCLHNSHLHGVYSQVIQPWRSEWTRLQANIPYIEGALKQLCPSDLLCSWDLGVINMEAKSRSSFLCLATYFRPYPTHFLPFSPMYHRIIF